MALWHFRLAGPSPLGLFKVASTVPGKMACNGSMWEIRNRRLGSLGLRLIEVLVQQIKGEARLEPRVEGGAILRVSFPGTDDRRPEDTDAIAPSGSRAADGEIRFDSQGYPGVVWSSAVSGSTISPSAMKEAFILGVIWPSTAALADCSRRSAKPDRRWRGLARFLSPARAAACRHQASSCRVLRVSFLDATPRSFRPSQGTL